MQPIACPQCGRVDTVLKLSSKYRKESKVELSETTVRVESQVVGSHIYPHIQQDTSYGIHDRPWQVFQPPPQPPTLWDSVFGGCGFWMLVIGGGIVVVGLKIAGLVSEAASEASTPCIAFALLGVLLAVAGVINLYKSLTVWIPKTKRNYNRWTQAYYCENCQGAFVLGENKLYPRGSQDFWSGS